MVDTMKVGLLGCGAIGKAFADAIAQGKIQGVELKIIGDIIASDNYNQIASEHGCQATTQIEDILNDPPDLLIEAASQEAVKKYIPRFIEKGIDVIVMSLGAFADREFLNSVCSLASKYKVNVYLPSGAVGGLDIISSAKAADLSEVTLTTTKHPSSLEEVTEQGVKTYAGLTERTIVFDGFASEAVCKFPKNINVAAALSLAGIGPDKTRVVIIADPAVEDNIHEVEAKGDFGSFKAVIKNAPSPANKKTSYLACLSGIALLNKIKSNVKVGS